MKRLITPACGAVVIAVLATGCIGIAGGDKTQVQKPTTGQQLVDLKKARDAGAMTDTEYETQKATVLNAK